MSDKKDKIIGKINSISYVGQAPNQPAADPLKKAQIHDLKWRTFGVFQGVYLPVAINIGAKEKIAIPPDD